MYADPENMLPSTFKNNLLHFKVMIEKFTFMS